MKKKLMQLWQNKKLLCISKNDNITFIPSSVNINDNLELKEKLRAYEVKDNESKEWKSINKVIDDEDIEVKILRSSIDVNDVMGNYNKLRVKEGYTLQIYKLKFDDIEKAQVFAFKNENVVNDVTSENLITNDFEIVKLSFQEAEKSYLDAIESENTPEAYLQLVLLNNKLNEICNDGDNYELITQRTIIKEDNVRVDGPNFYYDDNGKATIEYFKKYDTYKGAYKRVINTFDNNSSRFKIVGQIVAVYM